MMDPSRQLGLRPTDRLAVTGANGWLGREMIHALEEIAPALPLLALGSRESLLVSEIGPAIPIRAWDMTDVRSWKPTILVHLAFLTKERLSEMPAQSYLASNAALSRAALAAYEWPSIRAVVFASSGAAITQSSDPYGARKAQDESDFAAAHDRSGIPTVAARAWSLTGRYCTKPDRFLFYDLIRQTMGPQDHVTIKADHEVWRRYVDAGQYLMVCLASALHECSGTIDSGGPLVEATGLAMAIQSALGIRKPISRSPSTGQADNYYCAVDSLEQIAGGLGQPLADLRDQALRSLLAFSRA
jgi:nucleoside-diphosphate-sugar epimerase